MEFSAYADWAIALANSGREPGLPDPLDSVEGLTAFLGQLTHGCHHASRSDLVPLRRLREDLRAVFEARTPRLAADRLNQILGACEFAPHIAYGPKQGWHLHPAPDRARTWRWPAAACGLGLAYLLMDYGPARLGVCAAPGCGKVFLDRSRPGTRRFCSPRCANRVHASTVRRRRRSAPRQTSTDPAQRARPASVLACPVDSGSS